MTSDGASQLCRAAIAAVVGMLVFGLVALFLLFDQGQTSLARADAGLSRQMAKAQVHEMEHFKGDLRALARIPSIEQAFDALQGGYAAHIPEHLRDMYVALNPHQGEDLSLLSDPRDGSKYSQAHAKHHVWLRELAKAQGFVDLFLVNAQGDVVYSVRKGRTFATRVSERDDELALREFARVVGELGMPGRGSEVVTAEIPTLLGSRETLGGTPILDGDGKSRGVLLVSRAAASPLVAAAGGPLRSALDAHKVRALMTAGGFGIGAFILLGIFTFLALRRGALEKREGLALIPVVEGERTIESSSSASHRSGTRPVASRLPGQAERLPVGGQGR